MGMRVVAAPAARSSSSASFALPPSSQKTFEASLWTVMPDTAVASRIWPEPFLSVGCVATIRAPT
jgi:hypothetical protein